MKGAIQETFFSVYGAKPFALGRFYKTDLQCILPFIVGLVPQGL